MTAMDKLMTRHFRLRTALLLCCLLSSTTMAAEGPLRSLIRDRVAARAAEAAGPAVPTTQLKAGETITGPGRYEIHLLHGGIRRMALVHVPKVHIAGKAAPVVMALHGGGGGMIYQASDELYGFISKSEQAGFIAVLPNGISDAGSGMLATWNAGNCCGKARDTHVDDVGFLRALVADLSRRVDIDRNRVFATGMSNGAMMSYRLACEAPDLIRGIAAVAGTDNTTSCTPTKPVPVLHIHARNDEMVLFNGGAGDKLRGKTVATEFVAVPANIAKWVNLNRANATARRVLSVPGAYCDRHEAGAGGAAVELCVTESGGHSWPGGRKDRGETPSTAIQATDLMWEFFSRL
jgi:polyhydroxybutyrate depolymerase